MTLGDLLGPLTYLGSCPCGVQHMSVHDRILRHAGRTYCARCADRILAEKKGATA